jgi:hypothetical protein
LVDALVRDCQAALAVLHGWELPVPVAEAAGLLALVAGQDVEPGEDGVFRIARRVAKDRIISTVDPQARHGHKSRHRTFDGYKTHLAADPDDELLTEVAVTAANTPDRDAVDELIAADDPTGDRDEPDQAVPDGANGGLEIFGDSAYADAETLERLDRGEATCPAGNTTPITPTRRGGGKASFGRFCGSCPLRPRCTTAKAGRSITIHRQETILQAARAAQKDPAWRQAYRATRPTAERKIAHFVRRGWGGRKARCRGKARILTDVLTRAAVLNLARLAVLGLHHTPAGWAVAPR